MSDSLSKLRAKLREKRKETLIKGLLTLQGCLKAANINNKLTLVLEDRDFDMFMFLIPKEEVRYDNTLSSMSVDVLGMTVMTKQGIIAEYEKDRDNWNNFIMKE